MNNHDPATSDDELRQQAEAKLREQPAEAHAAPSNTQRLVHELQVHQIELELQNEELVRSRAEVEGALQQYTDLYDFAPVGYCTLTHDGAITQVNHAGASLLGKVRRDLINGHFSMFVAPQSWTTFKTFLTRVFASGTKEECEIALVHHQTERCWIHLSASLATSDQDRRDTCRMIMVDVTERVRADQQRQDANERFSKVFRSSPIGINIFRLADECSVDTNETYQKMTGYTHEELVGHTAAELGLFVNDRSRSNHALDGEVPIFRSETAFRTKSGELRYALCSMETFEMNGEALAMVLTVDITDRKQAEESLRKLNERFQLVGEATNDPMWEWDLETGALWSNLAHQELFGLTLADPVPDDQEWKRRMHPDEAQQVYQSLQDARASTQAIWDAEYRFKTEHRGWIHIYARTYIERDAAGKAIRMIGTMMDITKRKQMEETLANERNLLRTLVDQLPDAIYVKDINGRFLLKNRADALKMGAATPQEMIGKNDYDYYPPELAARYADDDQTVMTTGQAMLNQESLTINAAGQSGWVSITKVPLRNQQGQIVGLVGIEHDITDQKQADQEKAKLEAQLHQAQKMESVGRLAGGVAHDFNNMLGVILGHTELALEEIDPALPFRSDIEEIRKAAQRSANLTRQLLAFARKQIITPKVLNLNDAVAGTLTMLQRMIGEHIELVWMPTDDLWPIRIDPTQIDQILANVCVNARDAISDVGTITIQTGTRVFDSNYCALHPEYIPGEYVMLLISDTGSGMDMQTQEHLFEPFFTTKPLGQGTGLGLATVYGIVKQNNGFIICTSALNQGTTFQIYLPRHNTAVTVSAEPLLSQAASGNGKTVLVVEDELSLLTLVSKMLIRQGYQVLTALSPREAIQLATSHIGFINLLITDVMMPGMNGHDLAKHLLSFQPQMKVLFMSGYSAEIIANQGVLNETVHFIQKPFLMKNLAIKISEMEC